MKRGIGMRIEAARPKGVIVAFGFAAVAGLKFDIRTLFFAQPTEGQDRGDSLKN